MLLTHKKHTAGNRRRFVVDYRDWLCDGTWIVTAAVTSSSLTATIDDVEVLEGHEVAFFVNDGTVDESFVVSVEITDSLTEVKLDTINFTVVAP